MGGAPQGQQELATAQSNFYNQLTSEYSTMYGENQNILNTLTTSLQPIVAAGPNQTGFSPAETSAMRSEATDLTAEGYRSASTALNTKLAGEGGGNAFIPSGANEELKGSLMGSAEAENAQLQENITGANYATGRGNYFAAENALGGAVGQTESPLAGLGGAASSAGSAANTTYNDIAQENTAWMGPVFGAIGAVGGAATGASIAKAGQ